MANTYILIDFENVQPKNLAVLRDNPSRLRIFVGYQQAKVPFELAQTMQSLGARAEYVQISGSGRNALDLHIAFYIGRLSAQDPDAAFHIVSKDRDYDVLIKHLQSKGIACRRTATVDEAAAMKAPAKAKHTPGPTAPTAAATAAAARPTAPDRLAPVITHLRNLKASRPRKVRTLTSTLKAKFAKDGSEREVQALVEELRRRGAIVVDGTNVTYQLDS